MSSPSSGNPKGVHRSTKLPSDPLSELWASIVVEDRIKQQLLGQAVVNFTVRPKVARSVLPLHGTILLVGLPGTGNPVDVHRATDAVLVQLDALAEAHTNLLFVATSNFPQAVDSAFTSRCDLVLEVPLPNRDACEQILVECLCGLGKSYDRIGGLASSSKLPGVVKELIGLDGRAIRKTVAAALTMRKDVAMDPNKLTEDDLLEAAKAARAARQTQGAAR